jgi:hypothetical protein
VELLLEIHVAALVQEQQGVEKKLVLRSACVKSASGRAAAGDTCSSSGAGTAGCGKAASAEVCLCEISYRVELLLEITALVQEQQGVESI